MRDNKISEKSYPEINAGGFTRRDIEIEFYNRIRSLAKENMEVLDFGAGRAAWFEDGESDFLKEVRLLKGRVKRVVACDIDDAVYKNKASDEQVLISLEKTLPFPDGTFDMIIADYVFEHVSDPGRLTAELNRVLKPGGWICARTPCKWSYISIGIQLIPNRFHSGIAAVAEPGRKENDVFSTHYKLNTFRDLRRWFGSVDYDNYTYIYFGEPAYHFGKRVVYVVLNFLNHIIPAPFKGNLMIFLRKKQ